MGILAIRFMISVILPTYNEAENIRELITRINHNVHGCEILVVDDDSPDMTWKLASGMKLKNVRVIRRVGERGLASAIFRGIMESKGDVVVWMDCDLSMPPEVIPRLLSAVDGCDVAIGSRYVRGGRDRRSFVRVFGSWLINGFATVILGYGIRDYDSGFVAARKKVFGRVKFQATGYGEYCIRFLYDCARKGFVVREVPYVFTDRRKGKSKSTANLLAMVRHPLVYFWNIVRIRLR